MSDETMRERLRAFRQRIGYPAEYLDDEQVASFSASEVARALAPREASPELAEAEARLRREATTGHDCAERRQCGVILDELVRLRAENSRLRLASVDVVSIRSRCVDIDGLEELLRREFAAHSAPWRNVAEAAAKFVEGKGK